MAAEPDRGGRGVPGMLAPGLCLQPVAASELYGRRDRRRCSRAPAPRPCLRSLATAPTRAPPTFSPRRPNCRACAGSTRSARAVVTASQPFPEADDSADIPPPETNPDSVVYLAFTSGTTGTPKGVMHSSNTLLANARAMVEDWRHDHTTILLSLSPLSHHIATVALAAGARRRHGAGRQRAARAARRRSTGSSRPARAM